MGLKRSPDAALKAAMLTAIVLVAAIGAAIGLALAWLLALLVPMPTVVTVSPVHRVRGERQRGARCPSNTCMISYALLSPAPTGARS